MAEEFPDVESKHGMLQFDIVDWETRGWALEIHIQLKKTWVTHDTG